MYSSTQLAVPICFNDIYPESDIPDISDLLPSLDRSHVFNMIDNIYRKLANSQFFNPNYDGSGGTDNGIDVVRFFLSSENKEFALDIINRYSKFVSTKPKTREYIGATLESGIFILRAMMALPIKVVIKSRAQIERDFLIVLLVANQKTLNRKVGSCKFPHYEQYLASTLLGQFANYDIVNEKSLRKIIILTQTNKCMSFFRFTSQSDSFFHDEYINFIHIYGIKKWQDYLKAFWGILAITDFKTGYIDFSKSDDALLTKSVIKSSSFLADEIIPVEQNVDYVYFRDNPFIEVGKDKFFVTNVEFVEERIYNSLFFIFKKIWLANGKNDGDFHRIYTTNFSEEFLFDDCMNHICDKEFDIKLTDRACKKISQEMDIQCIAPPDFYARHEKSVLLVENKDVKINKSVKENGKLEDYLKEFKNKMVRNNSGKPEGIGQLIRNIAKIQQGSFEWDNCCPSDSVVYPMLVVSDIRLTMPGMKNMLQYWFDAECEVQHVKKLFVKNVVLIDIGTIRLYMQNFAHDGIIQHIDAYYNETDFPKVKVPGRLIDTNSRLNSCASFSEYMSLKECVGIPEIQSGFLKEILSQ